MKNKSKFIAMFMTAAVLAFGGLEGCAVARDQSTAGEYIDDTAVTAKVKSRLAESSEVDAAVITVETMQGVVQLSGFAKSSQEKAVAQKLALDVKGVKSVKNDIIVKP